MKQDKFLLGILAGIVLLVAAALALFFIRQPAQDYLTEDTPSAVVHNYVYAIQQHDYDHAYGYLADNRNKPSPAAFRSALYPQFSNYPGAGVRITSETVIENGDSPSEAIIDLVILQSSGGPFEGSYRSNDSARLVEQDGEWKITYMPYPYWGWEWYGQGKDFLPD